jgi:hypothetical protein
MSHDVGHVGAGAELGIADIEEVGSPGQSAKDFPGRKMGLVVGGVAVEGLIVDRDGPVGATGEGP